MRCIYVSFVENKINPLPSTKQRKLAKCHLLDSTFIKKLNLQDPCCVKRKGGAIEHKPGITKGELAVFCPKNCFLPPPPLLSPCSHMECHFVTNTLLLNGSSQLKHRYDTFFIEKQSAPRHLKMLTTLPMFLPQLWRFINNLHLPSIMYFCLLCYPWVLMIASARKYDKWSSFVVSTWWQNIPKEFPTHSLANMISHTIILTIIYPSIYDSYVCQEPQFPALMSACLATAPKWLMRQISHQPPLSSPVAIATLQLSFWLM